MRLEAEVLQADKDILKKVDNLSKEVVIKAYRPLFDIVKNLALSYMEKEGVEELELKGGLSFRSDGSFYGWGSYNFKPVDLEELPFYYDKYSKLKVDKRMEFTKYHEDIARIFKDFKKTIQESLSSVLD